MSIYVCRLVSVPKHSVGTGRVCGVLSETLKSKLACFISSIDSVCDQGYRQFAHGAEPVVRFGRCIEVHTCCV